VKSLLPTRSTTLSASTHERPGSAPVRLQTTRGDPRLAGTVFPNAVGTHRARRPRRRREEEVNTEAGVVPGDLRAVGVCAAALGELRRDDPPRTGRRGHPNRLFEEETVGTDLPEPGERVDDSDAPRGPAPVAGLEDADVVVRRGEKGGPGEDVQDRRDAGVTGRHGVEGQEPVVLDPPMPEDAFPRRRVKVEFVAE